MDTQTNTRVLTIPAISRRIRIRKSEKEMPRPEIPSARRLAETNEMLKWRGLTLAQLCDRIMRHPETEPICIPGARFNEETEQAIRDANEGRNLISYNSLEDFMKAMHS